MTATREPGRINENTTMIDYGLYAMDRVGAVYLIQAGKTCLIDGGTRDGAGRIISALRQMDAFPDVVIITHLHGDHCQGIPALRVQAAEMGGRLEVMASENAIPILENRSWPSPTSENITGVVPLKEGDTIDLDGVVLRVFDTPGHCTGHIAVLDEKNGSIFVGDAIGIKLGDHASIPNFFLPYWDRDAYYATIDKLKHIDYDTLCLAHFGFIYGDEAKDILDECVATNERWWALFGQSVEKLDDLDYMLEAVMKEMVSPYRDSFLRDLLVHDGLLGSLITTYKTYENLIVQSKEG